LEEHKKLRRPDERAQRKSRQGEREKEITAVIPSPPPPAPPPGCHCAHRVMVFRGQNQRDFFFRLTGGDAIKNKNYSDCISSFFDRLIASRDLLIPQKGETVSIYFLLSNIHPLLYSSIW
jgi:hypothetical protein